MRWRRRSTTDFSHEIEAHVALETDRLIADGFSPEDAAIRARRTFGNVTRVRERFYESRRWMWLEDLRQDTRFAFRSLKRSPGFLAVNANKRGITLDLKDPAAVAWLMDFLGTADVLVQNLRPGSLEEMGLGPDTLLARHPRLIYCSVWAFGRSGPLKMKPGFEPMVQAFRRWDEEIGAAKRKG